MSWPNAPTLPTVVTAWDVEEAVISTLKARLPYYVGQLNYAEPRGYVRTTTFEKWPEDQLPLVIVISPGIIEPPLKQGDGKYRANWLVGAACMVSARTEDETRKMARDYGALIRATLLQTPSLGGFARGVTWIDETYDQVEVRDRRTLASAEATIHVEVGDVVDARELPFMPDMSEIPTLTGEEFQEHIIQVEPMEES